MAHQPRADEITQLNLCVFGDGLAKGIADPIGRGWAGLLVEQIAADHGPLNYYNLGVPGQSSAAVARRLGELAPRLPTGADNRLILAFGLADVVGETPLSARESLTHLRDILSAVHGRYKLLMVGPPAVYDPGHNARLKRLNGAFHELCQQGRVPYVDLFTSLIEDVQYRRELVQGDRLYPGGTGHRKLFDLISNDRAWWFG